jgi:hypothetical protein
MIVDYLDTDGYKGTAITLEGAKQLLAKFKARHVGAKWSKSHGYVSAGTVKHLKIDLTTYMRKRDLWAGATGDRKNRTLRCGSAAILIPAGASYEWLGRY